MICLNKKVEKLFTVLIILSMLLLLVGFCVGDDVKPVAPSFTLKEISQPYDVPPTTTTIVDGYTGEETTITYPGYHVENKTTYIVIKNQPFTPYKIDDYKWVTLRYEYSYKPHYSGSYGWYLQYYLQSDFWQADSEYTFIPFTDMPSKGQIDIRLRVIIGVFSGIQPMPGISKDTVYCSYRVAEGDYSVITVSSDMVISTTTMPSSPSGSSGVEPTGPENPDTTNPNPPQQQTPWATYLLTIIITTCIITIPITIVMYYNKRQQKKTNTLRLHKS